MNKLITIKMPKEYLRKWLEALRSGKYSQGVSKLKTENGAYCCLGVMQHCITGQVETSSSSEACAGVMPTLKWLREHKIEFADRDGELAGEIQSPFLYTLDQSAFSANDSGLYNFAQIADAIEACAEGM